PMIVAALPRFLQGQNELLQTVCGALLRFLNFSGRWDEALALELQAEEKAVACGDNYFAGWRAYEAGSIFNQRGADAESLACADRALGYFEKAKSGPRERSVALYLRGIGLSSSDAAAAIVALREAVNIDRSISPMSRDL